MLRRWSLGQAGSGGWSRQLLSGRTLVAAQPIASSMETARLLSHKVPLAVHRSLPTDGPGRRACVQQLDSRAQLRKGAGSRPGCAQISHHQPSASGPCPHLRPTSSFGLALPLLGPPLFSALAPRSTLLPKLSMWPPRALPDLGWILRQMRICLNCMQTLGVLHRLPSGQPLPVSLRPPLL